MAAHPKPAARHRETLGSAVIKFIVEVLLAIFLHPVAFVLAVIDIVNRKDMGGLAKFLWIIISFFWGIGPILYIVLGGGKLW
ncbi:MAG: hypothetical protein E6I04_08835 [Chloroflexi bacterium]|nr:MAG: hypothetical protein E6I92_11270 [Chloroflexota bacterium]TMF21740.1 MAG: hypothetical protein E6I36_08685 [Chloroflexota bacterium]TMF97077.1 MAG: hypothetical protein E6I04_08835 [Chloroflexota bacterium]